MGASQNLLRVMWSRQPAMAMTRWWKTCSTRRKTANCCTPTQRIVQGMSRRHCGSKGSSPRGRSSARKARISRSIKRLQTRSDTKVRAQVEHVFGSIQNELGSKFIRGIGIERAHSDGFVESPLQHASHDVFGQSRKLLTDDSSRIAPRERGKAKK